MRPWTSFRPNAEEGQLAFLLARDLSLLLDSLTAHETLTFCTATVHLTNPSLPFSSIRPPTHPLANRPTPVTTMPSRDAGTKVVGKRMTRYRYEANS